MPSATRRRASSTISSRSGATASAPSITTTSSPRGSESSREAITSETRPRTTSSWSFVSSRATAARRSPSSTRTSRRSVITRSGDSNRTTVRGSCASARRRSRRSLGRRGRKPSNTQRSVGRPETTSAAVTADGPGTTLISTPASTAARRRRNPGSETAGMPASETSATRSPSRRRSSSSSMRCRSLPSKNESMRTFRPRCASSRPVRRVSSAATRSTEPSVSRARCDRSARLPIGVPTTYRWPVMSRWSHAIREAEPPNDVARRRARLQCRT